MIGAFGFGGVRIIEDVNMVEALEDWSCVRSPARAAQRRKKHRQNITVTLMPKTEAYQVAGALIMHPVMAAQLRRRIKEQPTLAMPGYQPRW